MTRRRAPWQAKAAGSGDKLAPRPDQESLRDAGALRNTVYGFLTQATSSIFTAGLTLYLARALGEGGFGVFALAMSIGTLALLASDAGISFSAARFIAERYDDRTAVADVAAAAFRLNLIAASAAAALLWVLADPIASTFGKSALVWPLRGFGLAVFGQSMLLLYLRIFAAVRRVEVGVRVVFLESLVETSSSIALVALGAGVTGAAFGRAAGYAVGAAAAITACVGLIGRRSIALRSGGDTRMRDIARYSGPLLITNSAYTLYATIDGLLIGAILSTNAVGLFSGPMRLISLLGYVGDSVAGALGPRVARTATHEPDAATWRAGVRWVMIFQALMVAPLLVWAGPIVVLLLGGGFRGGGPVLRALSLYVVLRGLSPVMSVSVNYLGLSARRIPIVLVALLLNVVLDVTLLPIIGVVGAAIGTGVAHAVYVRGHFRICRQVLGIPLRPLARTAVRSALGAAAMALVLLAVGTNHLSPLQWIVGLVGGTAAFLLVLLATREIQLSEVRAVFGVLRARVVPARTAV